MVDTSTKSISLNSLGIKNAKVRYQLTSDELHEETIKNEQGVASSLGAIAVNTGEFTGRSPQDRFIVKDEVTKDLVWWSDINIPFESEKFDALYNKVVNYLSEKEIYVRDSYACADENYKLNIRVVNEYPWSNMFAYNMFLRPTEDELVNFSPEWTVINAPGFMANPEVDGTRQHNFAILNFSKKIALIGGTGYTGEIKKGIFSALNFILPVYKNTLPMHCSANVGKEGDTAIFFGLSGTGKTTLSTDPERSLIGDDEHGWTSENRVFNFEGGCYAKVINLSQEQEPEIFAAIKKGAILENVIMDENGVIDFTDTSITQNTRVSYPINHIENIKTPHQLPSKFTLVVLAVIIISKELLFQYIYKKGTLIESSSLKADAWHHRADAITSVTAFIGISLALFMGPGYEAADDYAALFAALLILYNAFKLLKPALSELMDENLYQELQESVSHEALKVDQALEVEKCHIRKHGTYYYLDMHLIVPGELSVRQGHEVSHLVKDAIQEKLPNIAEIMIHIEPD